MASLIRWELPGHLLDALMHIQRELQRDREDEISLGDATGEERARLQMEQRRRRDGGAVALPPNGQAAAGIAHEKSSQAKTSHEKDLLLRLVLAVRQGVAEKSVQQVPHLVILSSAWYAHACITLIRTKTQIRQPHLVILSSAWYAHAHAPPSPPNHDPNLAGTRSI
jgi:hypothetical protein